MLASRYLLACCSVKEGIRLNVVYSGFLFYVRGKCVPLTTAWHILGLRMEERPPDMEGSCEYTE
jgi:hypothetical protein